MADNLRWFKVWTSITDDPDFLEMELEDIGRWVLLGAYIGKHGEKGKLKLSEKALCQLLRCTDVNVTITKIHNVLKQRDISNAVDIVTFKNWHKYQVDSSAERVAKFRQNVTMQEENKNKKRIRREETIKEENKKRIYGEYKHVKLTDDEYQKLKTRFNSEVERKIQNLDEGIEQKGYKYKSHYLTILKWAEKEEQKEGKWNVNDW